MFLIPQSLVMTMPMFLWRARATFLARTRARRRRRRAAGAWGGAGRRRRRRRRRRFLAMAFGKVSTGWFWGMRAKSRTGGRRNGRWTCPVTWTRSRRRGSLTNGWNEGRGRTDHWTGRRMESSGGIRMTDQLTTSRILMIMMRTKYMGASTFRRSTSGLSISTGSTRLNRTFLGAIKDRRIPRGTIKRAWRVPTSSFVVILAFFNWHELLWKGTKIDFLKSCGLTCAIPLFFEGSSKRWIP